MTALPAGGPADAGPVVDGAGPDGRPISPDELEAAIRASDPSAFLVEPRVVRRVIRHDLGLRLLGRQVPHRKSCTIDAARALETIDLDELGRDTGPGPSGTIILLALRDPDDLARRSRADVLLEYWRLLFHARVHVELDRKIASGNLTPSAIRARIDRIGQAEFDEIRSVLREEHLLHDVQDPLASYVEFAAVYLELRHFDRGLIARYFPSLGEPGPVDAILGRDIDGSALFAATRLPGAPDPCPAQAESDAGHDPADLGAVDGILDQDVLPRGRIPIMLRRAERAAALGNSVRAAILRTRAARLAVASQAARPRNEARRELEGLAERLRPALGLSGAETAAWQRALPTLLERAARGVWSAEARLLYDLQKVALDHDRDIYTVDLVEWALTLGRRPIKRLLPNQRQVLIVKHLRAAWRRLGRVRLSEPDRDRLTNLIRAAVDRSEHALRERFRPLIARTLERTRWVPLDLPERVGLAKLIEELLDRIAANGFLAMGDLRDALSRNQLKLADLSSPREFFRGDRLLKTDRALSIALDGVYRRAEIYLRWLQRLSSLAFGTRAGRLLTLYVLLPFGGSFVGLMGLHYLAEEVDHLVGYLTGGHSGFPVPEFHWSWFLVFGLFLLGLVNAGGFRRLVALALRRLGRATRWTLIDAPSWLARRPLVRRLAASRFARVVWRWGLKPWLFTLATMAILPALGADRFEVRLIGAVVFLAVALLLNSRAGRDLEELAAEGLARAWRRLRVDLLPGLFRLVMEAFDRMLEAVERLLYTIDEWLRFKQGQGRVALVSKAVLGVAWFAITYVVRIFINLLIEPQVNPIKHFPVVTVSHKLMLPYLPDITKLLAAPLMPLGKVTALGIATPMVLLLPGVFGFLVWELKENWRLYEANRPTDLRPVVIGSHGETLARLLRPGFHSGTIPKLYARLRRAERKAAGSGRRRPARKYLESLRHVEHEVRRFVSREFLALLRESHCLPHPAIVLGEIRLGSNRIRIDCLDPDRPGAPLRLAFEMQSGWLLARVSAPGWTEGLGVEERAALATALTGLYKLAGVDLIHEQILTILGPAITAYDIADEGLVVWRDAGFRNAHLYDLRHGPSLLPEPPADGLPVLDSGRLLFRHAPLPWRRWVGVWEGDQAGDCRAHPALPGTRVLPDSPADLTGTAHER